MSAFLPTVATAKSNVRCKCCYETPDKPKKWPGCEQYHNPPTQAVTTITPSVTPPPHLPPSQSSSLSSNKTIIPTFASSCILPENFWTKIKLLKITTYNHDTSIFTFHLPDNQSLGLPTCACLLLKAPGAEHGGGDAIRPYTPVSRSGVEKGYFKLLVKQYKQWGKVGDNNYRPAGAVSSYLFGLDTKTGPEVDFKHIKFNVKLPYQYDFASGVFGFEGCNTITMIAVGVGIAPMIQALNELLAPREPQTRDKTKIVLLLGNRSVKDIIYHKELTTLETLNSTRFKVIHHIGTRWTGIISHMDDCPRTCRAPCSRFKPPLPENYDMLDKNRRENTWITKETIKKHAFPPSGDNKIFVCGLPSVYDKVCGARGQPLDPNSACGELGYESCNVIKF